MCTEFGDESGELDVGQPNLDLFGGPLLDREGNYLEDFVNVHGERLLLL